MFILLCAGGPTSILCDDPLQLLTNGDSEGGPSRPQCSPQVALRTAEATVVTVTLITRPFVVTQAARCDNISLPPTSSTS